MIGPQVPFSHISRQRPPILTKLSLNFAGQLFAEILHPKSQSHQRSA